ncbi:MAG: hypothetical protein AAGF54_06030, partial [Pseudomonadota bacterium]
MQLDIFVVQPLNIKPHAFYELLPKKANLQQVETLTKSHESVAIWLKRLRRGRGYVGGLRELGINYSFHKNIWKDDLERSAGSDVTNLLCQSGEFNINASVYYDTRLDYFILTYHASFPFSIKILNTLSKLSNQDSPNN